MIKQKKQLNDSAIQASYGGIFTHSYEGTE